jgi:hypothetical protein
VEKDGMTVAQNNEFLVLAAAYELTPEAVAACVDFITKVEQGNIDAARARQRAIADSPSISG